MSRKFVVLFLTPNLLTKLKMFMKHINLKKSLGLIVLSFMLPFAAMAQQVTVKGKVTDQNGEPLAGSGVVVMNTTNGVVTDFDGNYQLTVNSNAVLEFSSLGYVSQAVPVNGRAVINVQLEVDSELVEEAVVIGYGTARKSDVTGSIASVGGNDLREVPAGDITQALQGRIAGVDFQSSSSNPGASMTIRIRGERSLSASNDPLIVLDGVPFMGSLSDISTNDIKTLDVLKDAASTAIYGSRGANGVIIITTYKGVEGQDPKVSFNFYTAAKKAIKLPTMQGEKFVQMRKMAGRYGMSLYESETTNTDWQDMMYRTGITQNYELSVVGGTKGGSYRFGVSYYNDEAVLPTKGYDRISLTGSIDQKIGQYVRVGFTTNTSYTVNTGNQVGVPFTFSPIANPYDADGNLIERIDFPSDSGWYVWDKDRVNDFTEKGVYNSESNNIATYNTGYLQINIPGIKGLSYKASAGLNYRRSRGGSFTGMGIGASTPTSPNSASWSFSENYNWTVENLLTYDRVFGKHRVNVVGLYSAEQTTSNGQSLSGKNIPNELFQWYNIGACLASDITVNKGSYSQSGLISWMGRAMYTYDDKYMLSVAIRSDASSRLAVGHQWHTYPAVSVGWNLHKEGFMDSTRGWLDELKLRVGYGVTSNQSISPYATLGSLSTKVYNFNDVYATGYYVSSLPNTALGWEFSNTMNYGVDFSFLKGRLRGTFEYYSVKTHDILLSLGLPSTAGVSRINSNIGKTQNKGVELSLNGTIIRKGDWTWDLGLNIYANRNKLVELADGTKEDIGNRWFVGYPLNALYDYEYDGLWNEGDPYMDILEPTSFNAVTGYNDNVGMIKVKYHGEYDETGKPVRAINSSDQRPISAEATFMGGFNTRVAWKNLDLTLIGDFQVGGIFVSSMHTGYDNLMNGRRGQVDVDYWTPENKDAKYPRPGAKVSGDGDTPKYNSLMGRFDGSFLTLRTVTLGYSFHKINAVRKFGIDNLRVYFTAQNLGTVFSEFSRETGLIHQGNGRSGRMATFSVNTPMTRNFLFGVNLTF